MILIQELAFDLLDLREHLSSYGFKLETLGIVNCLTSKFEIFTLLRDSTLASVEFFQVLRAIPFIILEVLEMGLHLGGFR
jgi:hypothetical protein